LRKHESQHKDDRRRFTRYALLLPLRLRLLGILTSSGWTHARTVNVSFKGMSVELYDTIEKATIIPYLELDNVTLEVDIPLPSQGINVRAATRIIWYDWRAPSSARLGLLFEHMGAEDRTKWEEFVRELGEN